MNSSRCRRGSVFSAASVFGVVTSIAIPSASPKLDDARLAPGVPSDRKLTSIMIQMAGDPAAVAYAAALKDAQTRVDAQRNYALAHPNLKSSQRLLKQKATPAQISAVAARQVVTIVQQLDAAQQKILPNLTGQDIGGQVIYRAQRAYNGIAVVVRKDKIPQLLRLPGVVAIHAIVPKVHTAAFSDIDFLATRPAWVTGSGIHGENIKIAVVDTGLDYIHRDFGGTGDPNDYAITNDTSPVPNNNYPTSKIPGGIDLVGNSYNADPTDPDYQPIPHPDNNPFECDGHGTETASLATGLGLTSAGFTYNGNYNLSEPNMNNLAISPGFAPNGELYPVRVFGCAGSTAVVVEAIEWCMDPNGDGDFSDHMDVISMSLGSNEGFADDPDAIAASNAAAIGILVCSAAGNGGDSYYVHSSPAAATGTLSVAATFNDEAGFIYDSNVTSNTTPGHVFYSIYGTDSPHVDPGGFAGNVVYAVPADANAPALTNAAQVNGNICLIDRGTTSFIDKIQKAFDAGATAVIINNFTDNPNPFVPVQMFTDGQPKIPAVMISHNDRNTIVADAGGFDPVTGLPTKPVNITMNDDRGAQIIPALAAPDTVPNYTSRGPGLPDSMIKPDIAAPAQAVGVASPFTGNAVLSFAGTSSSTPHVSGIMALLRQLHPAWTVQELNGLLCATANHDLYTTPDHQLQYDVGRIGAGRVDVGAAARSDVTAFNGSDANQIGLSFGVVEVPVDTTRTVAKNIVLRNKGTASVTYNVSLQSVTQVPGAMFVVSPTPITVNPGASVTVPVSVQALGHALTHTREETVDPMINGNPRQWLTETSGYVVFTPIAQSGIKSGSAQPVLRVALYAAPKPASSMHSTITSYVPDQPNTGSFNIPVSGAFVNTGPNLGNGFDILSLVKAFELQYASPLIGQPNAPNGPNVIKYVGLTSDWVNRPGNGEGTKIFFGIEGFGPAATPDFGSSDKEVFIDTGDGHGGPPDGEPDFIVYLGTNAGANVYSPIIFNVHAGTATGSNAFTNGLTAAIADTNAYNSGSVGIAISASSLGGPRYPALGTPGHTFFQYQVVTFDRLGDELDETPVLSYDLANPGLEVENSAQLSGVQVTPSGTTLEPFYYNDVPGNFIPVNYNGTNFQANGSLGVLLLHMHNSNGNQCDAVAFLKPTVSGFNPTSGHVGAQITITGANFGSGTTVRFYNNQPAGSVNVITGNTLVATVPESAVSGPIRVSNAAGASTAPGNFTVLPATAEPNVGSTR
jgi:subtilisin family serine protease